jgi:hypothetical protein
MDSVLMWHGIRGFVILPIFCDDAIRNKNNELL